MTRSYDYIIVGAGSAGCVLANRLSEDPDATVVLIEAGGEARSLFVDMPAGFFQLMKTGQLDWGYHSTPQPRLGGRTIYCPRGRGLGGSSIVNGMIYVRGHSSDYDQWAQMGNTGWSYDDCLPYFRKSEDWSGPTDAAHGIGGPLRTSRGDTANPLSQAFIEAGQSAGYPYNDDFNSGSQEGFGPCDSTIADSRRWSARTAYLDSARHRPNLTVITGGHVSRVLVENGEATGIEYLRGRTVERINAARELIISAGAVSSPTLLQRSGIGDPDHLRKIGVPVTHELPGVGRNLQDHPVIALKQQITQPISNLRYVKPLAAAFSVARYLATRTGPAASHGIEALAFVSTRPGLVAPDLQFYMVNILYGQNGRVIDGVHGFMPCLTLQRPESRGSVLAASADPVAAPLIDLNYFDSPNDLHVMREGLKIARDIVAQPAFDAYRGPELAPGPQITSDAALEQYVLAGADTNYHLAGTCRMGTDGNAVVDAELRVRGIARLRVADASIMPTLVSGNTNAATIMIGERAAEMIRAA